MHDLVSDDTRHLKKIMLSVITDQIKHDVWTCLYVNSTPQKSSQTSHWFKKMPSAIMTKSHMMFGHVCV